MTNNCNYLNFKAPEDFQILCCAIGLDKAYVLARIHGWASYNERKENKDAYADGHYWMFATMEQLHKEYFAYTSLKSVQRCLDFLTKSGLLIKAFHNRIRSSRLWYRVNYDAVNKLCEFQKAKMTNSESEMVNLTSSPEIEMVNLTNSKNEMVNLTNSNSAEMVNLTSSSAEMVNLAPEISQSDQTIEISKENKCYIYSSLFASFSLLKKNLKDISMVEIDTEPDLTLEEAEYRLEVLMEWCNDPERANELGDLLTRNGKILNDMCILRDYIFSLRRRQAQ